MSILPYYFLLTIRQHEAELNNSNKTNYDVHCIRIVLVLLCLFLPYSYRYRISYLSNFVQEINKINNSIFELTPNMSPWKLKNWVHFWKPGWRLGIVFGISNQHQFIAIPRRKSSRVEEVNDIIYPLLLSYTIDIAV